MPSVQCLIIRDGSVLLAPRLPEATLAPIEGSVQPGESAIEACTRLVHEVTSLHVMPSCAGLIMTSEADAVGDYTLVFVAEAPADTLQATASLQWVVFEQLSQRRDVSELYRELIPQILTAGEPITVLLKADARDTSSLKVFEVAAIDPARLSPLVFAVSP